MNSDLITAAIGAHGLWKGRLRRVIDTGKADQPVDSVRDDHQCAFGKWLFGLDQAAQESKHYGECRELHRRFHLEAADIVSLATTGKKQEAAKALEPGQAFGKASTALTVAMQAWMEDHR